MFLFLVCSTKESAACSVACLLLLLLSINSSRFLLDSLLHLCTSLLFLLSSSCGFLTLSTDASQALQGGLRFRLRIREITKSEQSFLREFAGNTPPSVAASLARAYVHKIVQQLLLLSRDYHLQLAITIHRSFSLSITRLLGTHTLAIQISVFKLDGHGLALFKDLHST